ncbi:MAG: hypothetical protein EZS28_013955 [Streblomastix strix]|uniref:Uncharacterized protein n=1 Tax=Streblomastix strix TaxID=222440 RepID=A0A5J4W6N6_9EUKA|nr:MAG: hypothetical protein EZS28_013955 [Streblomastix strix]
MENQIYDGISNRQINIHYPYDKYIINNCTFSNCFATGNGGALNIQISNGSSTNIANCTFTNCTSEANGGAIRLDISTGSTSTFEGLIKFKNCTGNIGGALCVVISGINSQLTINQIQFEDCYSSSIGGGMYLFSGQQSHVYIGNLTFSNCSSVSSGGGAYIISDTKGYIQINNIKAENCKCIKGNGGGIFVNIDFGNFSEFKMVNISLFRCKALADTTKDIPPTGYGGGIFLTGYGDYDYLSKMLDFRKMKIYGNTADNSGQSLYVAITKVLDWCKAGTAGEYVKGNYSDEISNYYELFGIPVDSSTFNSYSKAQIISQQNYLYNYWNVTKIEYFVNSTGNNIGFCTQSYPCQTLDASLIHININNINAYFVYIHDNTSISTSLVISQTATPRTFRNYPLDSTQLSSILIKANGVFNINGKVRFQLINFIMESTETQLLNNNGIYGLLSSAEIDLQDCQFHMQNAGSQIGKCFIYLEKGGNHIISKLMTKDISSEENSIKIDLNQAGSIIISDSQFENITKIGNVVAGGAINAILQSSNKLNIKDCKFTTCKAQDTIGGAIYAEISNQNAQIILTRTQFLQCYAQSGGGLSVIIDQGQFIIENSCIFKDCNTNAGNGGGIYLNLKYGLSEQTSFVIRDALIHNCQAIASASTTPPTGFGGGIFIGVNGSRGPPSMSLDLKGMKIQSNSASQGGQSLFVAMDKLQQWCEYGLLGEYVKGNYSDTDSNENDLQGYPNAFATFKIFTSQHILSNSVTLEDFWLIPIPLYSIWNVLDRNEGQQGFDVFNCGETNSPCYSIEYAIQQISLNKGGLQTVFIEEKNIGISQYGYDLTSPIQLSKSGSHTNLIKIMKQMYGTPSQMSGNAEMKIMKNNDNNKENEKLGWISAFEGLQLHLYCLNIIMDNSQLLIPIIYIQDSDSSLELHTITFSGIKLSPSTESKGIIQINYDNSQFISQQCIFQNINIENKGGNTIRILNNGSYPITSTIKGCQFNNISSIGDSSCRGGSAIYMESKHGSKLIIEDSCQFYQCIIDKGNGGAIYIDIDFTSQFLFNINDALIQECIAKENTSSSSPTGYGGGIFLTGSGDYDSSTNRLDLRGMKIFGNNADNGGQSLYVAMAKVTEWCRTGSDGEYVKGNYSDGISIMNELVGIPQSKSQIELLLNGQIQIQQKALEYYWKVRNSIYHIQNRNGGQYNGTDALNCGEQITPCKTIEYAIDLISINKGGSETVFIEEKNIGISQYGYDLTSPIQLSKSGSHTDLIKIMKQMYGTPSQMSGNAEMKIMKNNDNNKENEKLGWIQATEGLQLHLYCLNIIMDNSQLLIPIIYIQDSNSLLELHTITFSGIKLSPSTESKGIIQINVDNSQFIAQSCIFQNIDISSKGGNAIRILNSKSYPITSTIKGCQFNNIRSIGDSNGLGGSAIYMESKHGSKLIIEESCQFYKCIIDKGNGGAIYIDIDFTSQFLFKIKDTLIQECISNENSISSSPTGYGGGIFLTGSGDYDSSTNRLDLKGMKIFGNSADQSGQSLFVAMTKIKDWCQTGTDGEFAKGNYTDGMSNVNELEGINVDSATFNSYSSTQIKLQQNYLESYWSIIIFDYYVNSTGNDDWQCNLSNPCKTIDESIIYININSFNAYFVYIYDSTSISTSLVISQTATPRTFRNYPLSSTQLSSILIKANGGFNINGKVRFQLINFIMESTQLQKNLTGIYGLSQFAEIDLQNCEFHMQNAGSQIGKCFIYLEKGGNHTISNLKQKDISSEENSIKIDFNQAGSIIFSDSQFENITKIGNVVAGGAINAILQSSNKLDIKDCKFTTCKAQDTFGGAICAEIKNSNAQIELTRTQILQCTAQSGGGLSVISNQGGSFIIENSCIFRQCNATSGNGGGLYLNFDYGHNNQTSFLLSLIFHEEANQLKSIGNPQRSFIIENSCIFRQCNATSGNGGGIYLNFDYGHNNQTSFVIRDALFHNCQAVASASATPPTGFGGGIFIGINGSLSPPSMSLDLKGIKIQGNFATYGGLCLYVVMDKLQQWITN